MTRITTQGPDGGMDMEYTYPGANNGRIASSTDHQSGELVNYTYDSLNRLVKAETAGAGWGDAYTYDGFGNLLGMTPTKQGGLTSSTPVDAATNRLVGVNYDANGNQTGDAITVNGWDVENRLATQISGGYGGMAYAYDPFGRRALKNWNSDPTGQHGGTGFTDGNSGPATATWEFYFYGITGQKLVTIECGYHDEGGAGPTPSCQIGNNGYNTNVYFGGKLLSANGVRVATDRLGSVRNSNGQLMNYFPYGQERTTTADGREKFATYFRDGVGQDYAEQRYYGSGAGRFWSPDRGGTGTEKTDPVTWNRYAYVAGDPVNLHDPRGLELMFAIQDFTSGSYDCTAFLAEGPGENPEVYVSWVDCVAVGTPSDGLPGSGGPAGVDSAPLPDQCMAVLYSRPVNIWYVKLFGGTHAYWELEDYNPNTGTMVLDDIVSSGPSTPQVDPTTGKKYSDLDAWVYDVSQATDDSPGKATFEWDTG